jgi:Xaa-Pro aminopeptidase
MVDALDRLMAKRGLDAIVVSGKLRGNPALAYLTRGAALTRAVVVKKHGEAPSLIVTPIEREIAQAAGLPIILETKYGYRDLLREHEGDTLTAYVTYVRRILADHEITGRVGFYGTEDSGKAYVFLNALAAGATNIEVIGEFENNVITEARATKLPDEVARIREVGRRTVAIVEQTLAFLQTHLVGADEVLRKPNGDPLSVGDVHVHIHHLILQQGLEDTEGFIFATGHDAGVPHNKGTPEVPMRLGESIVFDIFPQEPRGGYFFDMTRTFCLGYAPDPVQRLYEDVATCQQAVKQALKVDVPTGEYQRMMCECFQQRGHPTLAEKPDTLKGYMHTLGHGIGLEIHEEPFFRDTPNHTTRVQPGHVFTIEPGLYYPERGMGCRLEDVIWIDEEGTPHNLTDYAMDLIVPIR